MKLLNKILIANRGEIAVRVIRAAKSMGIHTVAIFSEADRDALHVSLSDEAYLLEGNELSETYLNIEKIIKIAKTSGCDAIHPGYGFLAENPLLVDACEKEGIVFIGPNTRAIELMGNKIASRDFVRELGIPMTEGATGAVGTLVRKAKDMNFPLLVKAAAGGGGKGMKIIHEESDIRGMLENTSREAKSYFGDGTVYLEEYIEEPRHIEIQILGDKHGNVVHLFERECTIQRRYQKIIEESPSVTLDQKTREQMGASAVRIAKEIGYDNAGTVEFLVDKHLNFYFLEMNTRIQVEHPVTEMVTGIDIVQEQISVAAGNKLSFEQKDIRQQGHAIECRIYAENPENDFMPSPGKMSLYIEPEGIGIRVDSSTRKASMVESFFDPMIAKLITHGKDREDAMDKMMAALQDFVIHGIKTNILYMKYLLNTKSFIRNSISTDFCNKNTQGLIRIIHKERKMMPGYKPVVAGMVYELRKNRQPDKQKSIWKRIGYWRNMFELEVELDGQIYHMKIRLDDPDNMEFRFEDKKLSVNVIDESDDSMTLRINLALFSFYISENKPGVIDLSSRGFTWQLRRMDILSNHDLRKNTLKNGMNGSISSPMPGKVIKIGVKVGDQVFQGKTLAIVEAMKMENHINAPSDGVVKSVFVKEGDMVDGGMILMSLEGSVS